MSRGHSQRRSCELIGIQRSALTYRRQMPQKDTPILQAMKRLAEQYPRYGYRRIRIFLRREGHEVGWEKARRLWRLAGLQLPKKRSRKRVATLRPRPKAPTGPNSVWAYDFVYDACANGQQIKCLTVIDEFTRECLEIDVAGGIRSKRVIEVLSQLVLAERHGRELQRAIPGRVPESRMVPQSPRGPRRHRNLAPTLQPGPAAFQSGLSHAGRVRTQSPFRKQEGRSPMAGTAITHAPSGASMTAKTTNVSPMAN